MTVERIVFIIKACQQAHKPENLPCAIASVIDRELKQEENVRSRRKWMWSMLFAVVFVVLCCLGGFHIDLSS
jgi:hypothetical protein